MLPKTISPTIVVEDLAPARTFYTTHLDGRLIFDCGWYIGLQFGQGGPTLHFMQPKSPDQPVYGGGGLTYNLLLADAAAVERAHERVAAAGLPLVMPLEDHPWGDRGFCTLDPYGVALYVYVEIEPSEEFRQYFL
ncbi:Glyoxalase/bleomycin resistance protein/dioxygenase [Pseudodesulfovibrio mercurii]|uniref:Glyoxalase/bleomycin resistance protein/dioxygenase n=1 Tax=Pseudodesulfovibrio mercurii TaxID=641491 RepID=F0JBJ3_9BACT|nr:VOC family protein [Pseudodesulfovibrio mercurii]EGB14312.1 Glyoxalase/bleomycin resistance protein/dioxygenase [Pseudodesulfovibrio mercurii]